MPVEPVTIPEWQQAADAASLALLIDAARRFGLVSGGPTIHVSRCHDLLRRARRRSGAGLLAHVQCRKAQRHAETWQTIMEKSHFC